MAGHSKFKNIMHRKGAQDLKRAKIFAKLSREITVAARSGVDPEFNPRLRAALSMARTQNMPKDKVQIAIQKASGGDKADDMVEIRYEGYGPGGAAVIVEALTDNKNRTATEVRTAFGKNGGQMGELGGVAFLFERVGFISYKGQNFDKVMEVALNHNAKDVFEDDNIIEIIVDLDSFAELRDACLKELGDPEDIEIIYMPKASITLDDSQKDTFEKMVAALEDLEDVQNVFHNVE